MGGTAAEWFKGLAWPVEVHFIDATGAACRVVSSSCSAVRFEEVRPVRSFRWSPGLGHYPGWWWAATTGRHVGYESWLERDHVQALDFDQEIVGIASQPFWLRWEGERGQRRHAPDYFARRADGSGVVVDVRADDRIEDKDVEAFAVTAQLCDLAGWEFRRVGEIDPVLRANISPKRTSGGEPPDPFRRTLWRVRASAADHPGGLARFRHRDARCSRPASHSTLGRLGRRQTRLLRR
ncbi:hypothetical protein Ppa06_67460 [Planomonospora parontospora subsp. parontospora]|uniref:TnsA-like heteromeric transposase endonuclease subunit n=2 Tax=Planomonospora parontospora TaxID=58119 RepID=A0AA37BPF8_9ACTN|nr:hypothetical protein GCM10010126_68660 [Planomonospora parontospora]GII12948.1 hypothetical protein Ppa06_67460 [Planomonospora parontospora subsp. parontospora]